MSRELVERAAQVERSFKLAEGVYLLGSMEKGLTLYNQQVRAHNLVWALWELERHGRRDQLGKVAVIGAGAAGLTATAGILARYDGGVRVTLFEELWDLCPLQQGSDGRWLHPRIYEWPDLGSRAPGASLPLLNWSEGRASDVARMLVKGFADACDAFGAKADALSIIIGHRNFQLRTQPLEISWIGTRAERQGAFFQRGATDGNSSPFDTVILAAGFGLEQAPGGRETISYWRNEQLGQPQMDGHQRRYLVSGYGDGALIDLCRLTIERFRQDTIVYELFDTPETPLEKVEERIRAALDAMPRDVNLFAYFASIEGTVLASARERMAARMRKDTAVMLHIAGRDGKVKSFAEIFGPTSSRLNRLLAYLLYRCGAFSITTTSLDEAVTQFRPDPGGVPCRHGTDTKGHLRSIIFDFERVERRLDEMRSDQAQTPVRAWKPGAFPSPQRGMQR